MRIVSSPRFTGIDAPRIRQHWTLEDLIDAHLTEDMYAEAEEKAAKK
jgi:hypothetical protein